MTGGDARSPDPEPILRLVGVYDADGTLRGEISYWIGARLGRAHCSLCDITHGSVRVRPEWRACTAAMPVPFDTYHRDDQPERVRAAAGGAAPVVVAETASRVVLLLSPARIERCRGSVDRLAVAVDEAIGEAGLALPPAGAAGGRLTGRPAPGTTAET